MGTGRFAHDADWKNILTTIGRIIIEELERRNIDQRLYIVLHLTDRLFWRRTGKYDG
jgi:hypothetical protein